MFAGLDKGMLLVLFPFFTIVLLLGFIALYTRGGRPINLRLKGLGIEFTLQGLTGSLLPCDSDKKEVSP